MAIKPLAAYRIACVYEHVCPDHGVRRSDLGSKPFKTRDEFVAAQNGLLEAVKSFASFPPLSAKTIQGRQRSTVHLIAFEGERVHSEAIFIWPQEAGRPDTYKAQITMLKSVELSAD